jgi:hypothetical protein
MEQQTQNPIKKTITKKKFKFETNHFIYIILFILTLNFLQTCSINSKTKSLKKQNITLIEQNIVLNTKVDSLYNQLDDIKIMLNINTLQTQQTISSLEVAISTENNTKLLNSIKERQTQIDNLNMILLNNKEK